MKSLYQYLNEDHQDYIEEEYNPDSLTSYLKENINEGKLWDKIKGFFSGAFKKFRDKFKKKEKTASPRDKSKLSEIDIDNELKKIQQRSQTDRNLDVDAELDKLEKKVEQKTGVDIDSNTKKGPETNMGQNIDVALKVKSDFKSFKDNFEKNHNSFPDIKSTGVKIGSVTDNNKIMGLIAYAYPDDLKQYRRVCKDIQYNMYGHIFDFEVRGYNNKNISDKLIEGVIDEMKSNKIKGVTLKATDQNMAKYCKSKYKFDYCKGQEEEVSPMMYLKF